MAFSKKHCTKFGLHFCGLYTMPFVLRRMDFDKFGIKLREIRGKYLTGKHKFVTIRLTSVFIPEREGCKV